MAVSDIVGAGLGVVGSSLNLIKGGQERRAQESKMTQYSRNGISKSYAAKSATYADAKPTTTIFTESKPTKNKQ